MLRRRISQIISASKIINNKTTPPTKPATNATSIAECELASIDVDDDGAALAVVTTVGFDKNVDEGDNALGVSTVGQSDRNLCRS